MAAKKKPTSKKSYTDPYDGSDNGKMARAAAIEITGQYMHAPNNRAQVIMPPGANFVQGSGAWFTETKGRFRAADRVYIRSYNEIKSNLDKKIPSGAKKPTVSKVSKTSKKK